MFGFIKNLFSSDTSTYSFFKLYRSIESWKKAGRFPYTYELPEKISFSPRVHTEFIKLFKATRSDRHERAITLWLVDSEIIVSSVIKGTTKQVTPKSNISIKYDKTSRPDYFDRKLYVDNKLYSKKRLYYKRIPKKVQIQYLFNMHTHPPHSRDDGSVFYSFFSLQDVRSLVKSGAVLSGMIGDKLYLMVRTMKTPSTVHEFDERLLSPDTLYSEFGIVTYIGSFKEKLQRQGIPG